MLGEQKPMVGLAESGAHRAVGKVYVSGGSIYGRLKG